MNQYVTGAVIRQLREKSHLTQSELAERLCVSDKTVSKWETDDALPGVDKVIALCNVFNITTDELLRDELFEQVFSKTGQPLHFCEHYIHRRCGTGNGGYTPSSQTFRFSCGLHHRKHGDNPKVQCLCSYHK